MFDSVQQMQSVILLTITTDDQIPRKRHPLDPNIVLRRVELHGLHILALCIGGHHGRGVRRRWGLGRGRGRVGKGEGDQEGGKRKARSFVRKKGASSLRVVCDRTWKPTPCTPAAKGVPLPRIPTRRGSISRHMIYCSQFGRLYGQRSTGAVIHLRGGHAAAGNAHAKGEGCDDDETHIRLRALQQQEDQECGTGTTTTGKYSS